jgi:hypothetical protein
LRLGTIGSSIWKVAPSPNVDSTQMRPPCISTICLATARPKPVPPLAFYVQAVHLLGLLENARAWCACGISGPVSVTLRPKWPLLTEALMHTSPASGWSGWRE